MSPGYGGYIQPGQVIPAALADLSWIVPTAPIADTAFVEGIGLSTTMNTIFAFNWSFNSDGSKRNITGAVLLPNYAVATSERLSVDCTIANTTNQYVATLPTISYSAMDVNGFVGNAVPACAISPPVALPTVGDAIKSANFTKLFNPLGISLKDI